jgi:hypothetical protein
MKETGDVEKEVRFEIRVPKTAYKVIGNFDSGSLIRNPF